MNISMTTGAARTAAARTGSGLRGTTPESVRSGKLSKAYHQDDAPRRARTHCLRMLKLAAPRLGIDPIKLALIDVLFACSKPVDWTDHDGIGPVVWPSNILLARRMNMRVNTMRYHLRGLSDMGIISWCDDAGYRRHGKRDENGRIIEAFGIDLSPASMRYEEFKAIVEAAEEDAREIDRLRKRRTSLDKAIRSLVDSAVRRGLDDDMDGAFSHGMAQRDVLCERRVSDLDELTQQVGDFEALLDRLETLYDKASSQPEEHTEVSRYRHPGVKMLTPITYTAPKSDSDICNQNGIALKSDTQSLEAACGSMAFEKKPRGNPEQDKQAPVETEILMDGSHRQSSVEPSTPANQPTSPDDSRAVTTGRHHTVADTATQDDAEPTKDTAKDVAGTHVRGGAAGFGDGDRGDDDVLQLSIGLVRDACPAINAIVPGALDHWQTLRDCGHALCAGTDINPQVFDEASQALGPDIAIAAIAVTVQKAAQGDVFKPGAYLRTLTKRGKAGELHIAKSLHGLAALNGMEAEKDHQTKGSVATERHRKNHDDSATETAPPFPETGSIAYSPWADIVRQNAPKPVPDVDRVANAFRAFCNRHDIDMTSPNIKTVFTTFASKWKERQ